MSIQKHLLVAVALLGVELWLGIGLLVAVAAIMVIVKLCGVLFCHSPRKLGLQVAAVYMFVFVGILSWINFNWKVAERHAEPVIAACEAYRVKNQRYPESVEKLKPEFLPAVPQAGLTRVSKQFWYSPQRPSLSFAAMFHGVASYDFQTHTWTTND